jgi:restriction system protein
MSDSFKNSMGAAGSVSNVSAYAEEIEKLLGIPSKQTSAPGDETVEDAVAFVMEKHLEDFLVHNWSQTELGKDFDIYEEEGVVVGQQYVTDTGPLDILAISKDKKRLLVIELKKGRPATWSLVRRCDTWGM